MFDNKTQHEIKVGLLQAIAVITRNTPLNALKQLPRDWLIR